MGNNSGTVPMQKTEQRQYQPSAMNNYEESKQDEGSAIGTVLAKVQIAPHHEEKQQESEVDDKDESVNLSKNDLQSQLKRHLNSPRPDLLIKSSKAGRKLPVKGDKSPPDRSNREDLHGHHGQKHTADKSDQKLVNNYYDDNFNPLYQEDQYQNHPQAIHTEQHSPLHSDLNQRMVTLQETSDMPFSLAQQTNPDQLNQMLQQNNGSPKMVNQSTQWNPHEDQQQQQQQQEYQQQQIQQQYPVTEQQSSYSNNLKLPPMSRAETIIGLQAISRGDTIRKMEYVDHAALNLQPDQMLHRDSVMTGQQYDSTMMTSGAAQQQLQLPQNGQQSAPPTQQQPNGEAYNLEEFIPNLQQQASNEHTNYEEPNNRLERRDLDYEQDLDYQMISELFNISQICEEEEYNIKRTKNTLYRGTLVERKRQGLGVLIYENGRVYEGEWQDDLRNGRGYELFKNKSTYIGQYLNNKIHGKGTFTWPNGEIYDGEWTTGIKQGFGIWKGTNGESYIGEWKEGKVHGYGVHQWKNGDRYEGEWDTSLKHGKGSDSYENGDTYTGEYEFGKPHGQGHYKWKNGASYVGNFANGIKDGAGKWKKDERPNCNQYDGHFFNDMKHGFGTFTWESGNCYVGDYWMDLRQGYGKMAWNDGSHYEGEWHQGLQNGPGKLTLPDGRIKEGLFRNNKFHGGPARLPVHTRVGIIREEEEDEDAVQESAKSDYIPPHTRHRSVKPIGQDYTQQVRALAPPKRSMSPLLPNEKKESKGHDLEKYQQEQDRMLNQVKFDHVIDMDSEPCHSELHSDNKEHAKKRMDKDKEMEKELLREKELEVKKAKKKAKAKKKELEMEEMEREKELLQEKEKQLELEQEKMRKKAKKAKAEAKKKEQASYEIERQKELLQEKEKQLELEKEKIKKKAKKAKAEAEAQREKAKQIEIQTRQQQRNQSVQTSNESLNGPQSHLSPKQQSLESRSIDLTKYMVQEESDEEEVVIKHIPTKSVKKRAPQAREFKGVQNKKVDVTLARSKVDTGARRRPAKNRPVRKQLNRSPTKQSVSILDSDLQPSTSRPARKSFRQNISPRGQQINDTSTLNSVEESMSKLSPRTLRKTKTKKPKGRNSPQVQQSNTVDVVDEGDSFDSDSLPVPSVTTKQPAKKQLNERLNESPTQMRRSNSNIFPKSRKKTVHQLISPSVSEAEQESDLSSKNLKNQDKDPIVDDSRSGVPPDMNQSHHITATLDGLDMNMDLTPTVMRRKPQTKQKPAGSPNSVVQKQKSPKKEKPKDKSRNLIENIDSNFQISKQNSDDTRHSHRTEQHRQTALEDPQKSIQFENQSPKNASPQNTSEAIAQMPSVLHEGGAPENTLPSLILNLTKNSTSDYGTEVNLTRRLTDIKRNNQEKNYIELEDYAPASSLKTAEQPLIPKTKKKKEISKEIPLPQSAEQFQSSEAQNNNLAKQPSKSPKKKKRETVQDLNSPKAESQQQESESESQNINLAQQTSKQPKKKKKQTVEDIPIPQSESQESESSDQNLVEQPQTTLPIKKKGKAVKNNLPAPNKLEEQSSDSSNRDDLAQQQPKTSPKKKTRQAVKDLPAPQQSEEQSSESLDINLTKQPSTSPKKKKKQTVKDLPSPQSEESQESEAQNLNNIAQQPIMLPKKKKRQAVKDLPAPQQSEEQSSESLDINLAEQPKTSPKKKKRQAVKDLPSPQQSDQQSSLQLNLNPALKSKEKQRKAKQPSKTEKQQRLEPDEVQYDSDDQDQIENSDTSEEEIFKANIGKKKHGVRNSVQPSLKKQNPLLQQPEETKNRRKFTSDSMHIPESQLKKMAKEKSSEYESHLSSPRLLSGKPRKLRRDGSVQLSQQQERQKKLKQINARQESPQLSQYPESQHKPKKINARHESPQLSQQQERQKKLKSINARHDSPTLQMLEKPKQKKYGVKLPKIVSSPFRGEASPMSLNDGMESSMLSHKRRAVPKRKRSNDSPSTALSPLKKSRAVTKIKQSKDSPSTAMSPPRQSINQPDYMSRLTDLSSAMDIEIDPPINHKRKPQRNGVLPRLNHSTIVHSAAEEDKPINRQRPSPRLMKSAAKVKPKRPARPVKDDESNLSSTLLKQLATDSDIEQKKLKKHRYDDSEDDHLDEIKEQRLASRRAIDMLMKGMKKEQKNLTRWVPNGPQSNHFNHTNERGSPMQPNPQKSRF